MENELPQQEQIEAYKKLTDKTKKQYKTQLKRLSKNKIIDLVIELSLITASLRNKIKEQK